MSIKDMIDNPERPPCAISYRCMADIKPEPIHWLWQGIIARGKITMIAGDPGLGKSQLTAFIAATVTNGGNWPVDNSQSPQGNVVILSAEDDAADTIQPRLEAVGADLNKVLIPDFVKGDEEEKRSLDLRQDIQNLDAFLNEIGGAAVIIIDPISAYLGGVDGHKNADVRGLLTPLTALAAKHNVAVICITHLNKGESKKALQRVSGSMAFVAAARAAYLVVKDQDAPERRLLLPIKNNIGIDSAGFAFSIEGFGLPNGLNTSKIVFENEAITTRADEILSSEGNTEGGSALEEACSFLLEELESAPKSAKDIEKSAKDAGISVSTLRRAKDKLGVISKRFGQQWKWVLPEEAQDNQDAHQSGMNTLDALNLTKEVLPCKD